MTRFLQLHLLTAYPPANLNRDDTGRPKTAQFGGATRLRVSSQALKRAWRTSDVFERRLKGRLGERTQRLGEVVERHLREQGVAAQEASRIAILVARGFGKSENDKRKPPTYIRQLAFVSPEERAEALRVAERLAAGEKLLVETTVEDDDQDRNEDAPSGKKKGKKEAKLPSSLLLRTADTAVDIAMFGRMLADDPAYNREAAVQVAHAITTHKAVVEDDYYTAVDDLKLPSEDAGAGFVGEAGFGAGLFYLYACVNRDLLVRNLGGDEELAGRGIAALVEAAATVSPRGKQASFASRASASFVMAEKGEAAPRTLAAAFLRPIAGEDILTGSIGLLEKTRADFARAYGESTEKKVMNSPSGEGTLAEVVEFAAKA